MTQLRVFVLPQTTTDIVTFSIDSAFAESLSLSGSDPHLRQKSLETAQFVSPHQTYLYTLLIGPQVLGFTRLSDTVRDAPPRFPENRRRQLACIVCDIVFTLCLLGELISQTRLPSWRYVLHA